MAHSGAEVHVKPYILVFVALLGLTIVTVGVSYLHLPTHLAILLAMIVASIKGTLVAGYFMHLIEEKKVIYYCLILTLLFFVVLMVVPAATIFETAGHHVS